MSFSHIITLSALLLLAVVADLALVEWLLMGLKHGSMQFSIADRNTDTPALNKNSRFL